MEKHQYESVQALLRQIHINKNVSRPQTDEEASNEEDKEKNQNHSLPILAVEKTTRKRSLFESTFKIPILTISGPATSPETPEHEHEHMAHRRFSFGHFRRHSHSSVRYLSTFI